MSEKISRAIVSAVVVSRTAEWVVVRKDSFTDLYYLPVAEYGAPGIGSIIIFDLMDAVKEVHAS